MATWGQFRGLAPDLAATGASLLYQHGVGLAYLATVGVDGSPRVHPICPLLHDDGIYAFIIPSPKQRDLHRDGRYALHSFPRDDDEDAFYLAGTARRVTATPVRRALSEQFVDERRKLGLAAPADDDHLFEFDVARCLLTETTGHGDPNPTKTRWQDPGGVGRGRGAG